MLCTDHTCSAMYGSHVMLCTDHTCHAMYRSHMSCYVQITRHAMYGSHVLVYNSYTSWLVYITYMLHAHHLHCIVHCVHGSTRELLILGLTFHPIPPPSQVDHLLGWVRNSFASLAMVDYPYPASFLAPLPAYPMKVRHTGGCHGNIQMGTTVTFKWLLW